MYLRAQFYCATLNVILHKAITQVSYVLKLIYNDCTKLKNNLNKLDFTAGQVQRVLHSLLYHVREHYM
jgi:hypothetical protein